MSHFDQLTLLPPDAIFYLTDSYKQDTSKVKINLGVGAYRDDNGKPYVLKVVRKAEQMILSNDEDHEYLPITGLPLFRKVAMELVLGECTETSTAVQCISGTGALRVGAEFLNNMYPTTTVYISNPTWVNHRQIFESANCTVDEYRYFDSNTIGLAFDNYKADVEAAPNKSIFVVHACAHNPSFIFI